MRGGKGGGMIFYGEALRAIREHGGKASLSTESVSLEAIAGRICAEEIRAPRANQPFDNSSRDGFAVRSVDLDERGAGETSHPAGGRAYRRG